MRRNPISAHQSGQGVDFRPTQGISRVFDTLRDFASFSMIDETDSPKGPHWHIFVRSFSEDSYDDIVENTSRRSASEEGIDPDVDVDIDVE